MPDQYKSEIIDPGDRASAFAKEICFKSHGNSQAVDIIPHQKDNFRGAVGWRWKRHILEAMMDGLMTEEVENDGAGGKLQFHALIGTEKVFRGAGWEIIEMCAEDLVRTGRFPVIMDNEIQVKRLTDKNFHLFQAAMEGYGAALKKTGLVNITGEIAIMKHNITAFSDINDDSQLIMTWGASCVGLCHKDKLITGKKIRPGQIIIGFPEKGYRCNGGTFFTNLLRAKFKYYTLKIKNNPEAMTFAEKLTVPSVNYSNAVLEIIGWNRDGSIRPVLAKIFGIAHITGGGVWGKFGEMLPNGVGAVLDNMPEPPQVLREAQELAWRGKLHLSDWQAYSTFHGGCGMFLITDADGIEPIISIAKKFGIKAQVVGRTTKSKKNEIIIHSRFREERKLSSLAREY